MFNIGDDISPDQAMRFALEVAKEGRGFTSPNPLVGCVVVDKDHKFLSSGAHLVYGEAHAEVNALFNVKDRSALKGSTIYVTLEPCAHKGNTGSCAHALAKLPIKKVVYGLIDPNPETAGKGVEHLRINNVEVQAFDKYKKQCEELCEHFLFHMKKGRPFVSLKMGISLDGKIALHNGESQWITNEESRKLGRKMRAHYDATMIGAGTLLYDNPSLDFRDTEFEGKKSNKIIIVDPKGKAADKFSDSKIAQKHEIKNIFVLTRPEHASNWSKNLVPVIKWESSELGWNQAFKNLYNRGISSIYVEGGSYVFGQMLQYRLAQKLYMFQAPKIIGAGKGWSDLYESQSLDLVPKLHNWHYITIGEDRLNIAYF